MQVVKRGLRLFAAIFPEPVKVALLLVGLTLPFHSIALPIYSDTFWNESESNFTVDGETRKKAAQIRRLTEYIRETFRIGSNQSIAIVSEAVFQGSKHDIRPELILAIIGVESTFRERAVSSKGARGLMQILPRAHPKKVRAIGGKEALFDRSKNIAMGVTILNEYLARSNGNLRKALLRYNGSLTDPTSKYAKKVMGLYRKFRKIAKPESLS